MKVQRERQKENRDRERINEAAAAAGVLGAGDSSTYLVHFPEGSIAQFSYYLPDVVGINVPVHVLVLFDFFLDLQSW